MAVTVVATGEASKQKLREKGVEPDKIQSSVTKRVGRKTTKTTFTSEGEVSRIEERTPTSVKISTRDLSAEQKGSLDVPPPSLTTKPDEPTLLSPSEQAVLVDAQGRQLSRFESAVVESRGGGQSFVKPDTFGQEGAERFVSRVEKPINVTALNINDVRTKLAITEGAKAIAREDAMLAKLEKDIAVAIENKDKRALKSLQKERAEIIEARLVRAEPSFGKFAPLKEDEKATPKRVLEQFAGIESKGLTVIGKGAELGLKVVRERAQASDIPIVAQKFIEVETGLATGVTRALITNLGEDKTTAILTLATVGVGGAVGFGKGVLSGVKIAPVVARAGKVASKVAGTTLIVGGAGVATLHVATADDKVEAVGEVAGDVLLFGGAFIAGQSLGGATAKSLKSSFARIASRSVEGKVLGAKTARQLKTFEKAGVLSSEVLASPIEEVGFFEVTEGAVSKSKTFIRRGKLQKIDPSKEFAEGVKLDFNKFDFTVKKDGFVSDVPSPLRSDSPARVLLSDNVLTKQGTAIIDVVASKGSVVTSPKKFFGTFTGDDITVIDSSKALATGAEPDVFGTALRADVSRVDPKVAGEVRFSFTDFGTQVPFKPKQIEAQKLLDSPIIYTVERTAPTEFTLTSTRGGSQVFVVESVKPVDVSFVTTSAVDVGGGLKAQVVKAQKVTAKDAVTADVSSQTTEQVFSSLQTKKGVAPAFDDVVVENVVAKKVFASARAEGIRSPKTDVSIGASLDDVVASDLVVGVIPASDVSARSRSRSAKKSIVDSISDSVVRVDSAEAQVLDSAQVGAIDSLFDLSSAQAQVVDSAIKTDLISAQASASQRITKQIAPLLPPVGKRGDDVIDSSKDTFQAFSKIRGKLVNIGVRTSKARAIATGLSFVETTPARTFGVSAGTPFEGIDFDTPTSFKKKKSKKKGILFIEPSSKAIDTIGEFGGITAKGIASQKRKSVIKGLRT